MFGVFSSVRYSDVYEIYSKNWLVHFIYTQRISKMKQLKGLL